MEKRAWLFWASNLVGLSEVDDKEDDDSGSGPSLVAPQSSGGGH